MVLLNLLKAEILKNYKMATNIILLISCNLLVGLVLIPSIVTGLIYGGLYVRDFQPYTNLTSALFVSAKTFEIIGIMIAIIYMGNSVGSEYGRDTWKMILPRQGNRTLFLVSKLILAFLAMIMLVVVTSGFAITIGFVGAKLLHLNWTVDSQFTYTGTIKGNLKIMTIATLRMCLYGLSTFLMTIIARSVVMGIITGIGLSITLAAATSIPSKLFVRCMPSIHIENIYAHWFNDTKYLKEMSDAFGMTISPQISVGIIIASFALLIGLAINVFNKRDMAGL